MVTPSTTKPVLRSLARHAHRFERLSDTAIFCVCGEIRQVPEHGQQYHYCWHGCYHYPNTITYSPPAFTVWNNSGTFSY